MNENVRLAKPHRIGSSDSELTSKRELFLLDGVSAKSIRIDSNVVDFIVDDKQNLMVASEKGEMKTIHVAASLTAMQSERIDEISLSMISALKYTKKSILNGIAESFSSHPSINQVMELLQNLHINKPFTSEILEAIYYLIQSRPVRSIATQTRVMNHKTAIAALESYLQHSLGFQMTSPPHWTESVRSVIQKSSITSMNDTSISSHSQKTSTENSTIDDQPVPTRAWKFLPEKEKLKPAY
uniref:Uncharacterized protein n=1 Tax=Panagrolaimus davidi TaxID=227884 RepID=A0A914PJX8_9BILA